MRPRPRLAILVLAALLSSREAAADPAGPHVYAGMSGGYTMFDGSLRFPERPLRDQINIGGRLGYQWSNWLGLEGAAGYTPTEEDVSFGSRSVRFLHGSGAFTLSPYGGLYGAPFLILGGGVNRLQMRSGFDTTLTRAHLEFGAGLRFWITDEIGVRVEGRDLFTMEKDAFGVRHQTLIFSVGAVFAFGAEARDSDLDKVPDRLDQHPNTPRGAVVDARGVPIDSDDDGVFDGIDRHPNTPRGATIDAFGAPRDTDSDGVFDGLDTCADTPQGARVDDKGCPTDQDSDGVFDGLDQCAGTPAGFPVDEKGCPKDQDGDGVSDERDKCPGTAAGATVDSTGCVPVMAEVATELDSTGMIRLELGQAQFATGKADLPTEARTKLDAIGQVLSQRPELKIEIAGHTDTRGSTVLNRNLSQARARAVFNYLVQNFPDIKPDRFTVRGYGESRPLVRETSPEDMAKNRRVEFVILNREASEGGKPGTP